MAMGRKDGFKAPRTDSDRDLSRCPSQMKEREPKDVSICVVMEFLKEKKKAAKEILRVKYVQPFRGIIWPYVLKVF